MKNSVLDLLGYLLFLFTTRHLLSMARLDNVHAEALVTQPPLPLRHVGDVLARRRCLPPAEDEPLRRAVNRRRPRRVARRAHVEAAALRDRVQVDRSSGEELVDGRR